MRRGRAAALAGVALLVGGCGSLSRSSAPPPGWEALVARPAPFAALYRLDCCGRRNLLTTVRFDGEHLDLTVASPPGAALLRAWIGRDGGFLLASEDGCVRPLAGGELPLGEGERLPLDAELTAVVLSGKLPIGAAPLAGSHGAIGGRRGHRAWRATVEGNPPRPVRLVLAAGPPASGEVAATLSSYRQVGIPGAIELAFGSHRVTLALVAWRGSPPLAAPAWLSEPACPEPG